VSLGSGTKLGPYEVLPALGAVPTFAAVGGRHGAGRFILAVRPEQSESARLALVTNWATGLAK
jgi:hypothetical protein